MHTCELLIWHDPDTNAAALLAAVAECGARLVYRAGAAPNMLAVALPPQLCPKRAQHHFWQVRGVVLVQQPLPSPRHG
ncbi:hypothetical protein [Conchiformibius kuhniae]|uniref:Uncharacterized protein n=1 Tax=Conchiformibius kuhniae TaxID=211502 RepID=A0A8T9MWR0_9NEIS|nr:hypothetical protein [Conchiformibius kuhniae]UOP05285.1 hypothetical protein LVJ77_03490 [Conchiformibius kuhniae]